MRREAVVKQTQIIHHYKDPHHECLDSINRRGAFRWEGTEPRYYAVSYHSEPISFCPFCGADLRYKVEEITNAPAT